MELLPWHRGWKMTDFDLAQEAERQRGALKKEMEKTNEQWLAEGAEKSRLVRRGAL